MCNLSIMIETEAMDMICQSHDALKKVMDCKVPTDVLDEVLNDKLIKQVCVLMKLTIVALKNQDQELMEKLKKKRKNIVEQMMSKVDDVSGNVNDNQYLELCNFMKVLY